MVRVVMCPPPSSLLLHAKKPEQVMIGIRNAPRRRQGRSVVVRLHGSGMVELFDLRPEHPPSRTIQTGQR